MLDIAGRLETRGSEATAKGLHHLADAVVSYVTTIERIADLRASQGGVISDDQRRELYVARDAVRDSRADLGRLIRSDMRH
jgi:hypothetical protein